MGQGEELKRTPQRQPDRRKESFVRWQAYTITQLGYAINLVLSLSTGSVGFALILVKDKDFAPGCWGRTLFTESGALLIFSTMLGLWCVVNRLCDFRKTMHIARDREDWQGDPVPVEEIYRRLESRRAETKKLGRRTWTLFYFQIGTFTLGILLMIGAFVIIYAGKLF